MAGWRLFFAIELTPDIAAALAGIQKKLKGAIDQVRWVRPEDIHLTLSFLGEVDQGSIPQIVQEGVRAAAQIKPFQIVVRGCGAFPERGAPRVIWIGVDDPEGHLQRLQGGLARGLETLGFPREDRVYTPHLTIGRVKGGRGAGVREGLALIQGCDLGIMPVERITLFRSHLKPTGAEYTKVQEIPMMGAELGVQQGGG